MGGLPSLFFFMRLRAKATILASFISWQRRLSTMRGAIRKGRRSLTKFGKSAR